MLFNDPLSVLLTAAFIFGAIVGSFINVVGLRFLRGESIVWPGSHCYHCNTKIKPYDNIPIFSWLLLKGQCRQCHARISVQYPIIELTTALLFMAVAGHFGATWQALFLCILIGNLIVVLITDFREQAIFDLNSVGLIPFGLIYTFFNFPRFYDQQNLHFFHITVGPMFFSALEAIAGAFVLFFVLNLISKLFVGKPGFGEGDARLMMGIGSFFGLTIMLTIFGLGFVIQAAIAIPMLLWQWIRHRAYRVMAYLAAGVLLAMVPYVLQFWIHQVQVLLVLSGILGVAALLLSLKALKMSKELPMGLTYLPFGPALVFSCFLMIFYGGPITQMINRFLIQIY